MTTVEETEEIERRPDSSAERRTRRLAVRAFRPRRSWPAFLAGLVLLAAAVIIAAEIISTLAGAPLRILPFDRVAQVADARWNHPAVQVASGVLVLLGLLLVAVALLPGRGGYLPLRTGDPALVVGLSRSGMRSALAAAAREVDGVEDARVSVGRRRVRVRASTYLRTAEGLRDAVGDAVRERLAELDPLHSLTVRTRIRFLKT
ncbi:DUF6286 domain-containing protein [Allosalinactinospora lopnorensis]|uniref:DUF6286 domain-containing protein n=1 Tax=Allosalinactinospora lopnorensis TaxID=1352348 RepID=UPI000623FC6C|nr:DUF6286 domain-containing protein [Allosalinactinospora lopnorensis]